MASIKFCKWHPTAPWRVVHRQRSYYVKTKVAAKAKAFELEGGKGKFSQRELDTFRQAEALLGGTPLLVAVRAYAERHETTMTLETALARHMKEETVGRRPAYVASKEYNLGKLADTLGDTRLGMIAQQELLTARSKISDSPWVMNFVPRGLEFDTARLRTRHR